VPQPGDTASLAPESLQPIHWLGWRATQRGPLPSSRQIAGSANGAGGNSQLFWAGRGDRLYACGLADRPRHVLDDGTLEFSEREDMKLTGVHRTSAVDLLSE